MSDPARQLRAVGEATETMHGVAKQALEWVRVSEERVAAAEARADKVGAELKERAMGTLRSVAAEARERIAAERKARARSRPGSPAPRRRATAPSTPSRSCSSAPRPRTKRSPPTPLRSRAEAEESIAAAERKLEAAVEARAIEIRKEVEAEADRRVAAAEQRAADAEAAAAESHETAVRLETEIERRVMDGTVEVRREAEESVRNLVEKVEREAEEAARARAEDQLRLESDRIRTQAEKREERVREATEDEIKASAKRAKREAQAAAEESAPVWLRGESTLVDRPATAPFSRPISSSLCLAMREVQNQGHAERRAAAARPRRRGGDLRLRADRLQPHPHRQRPALRRLLPLRPLPALGGLPDAAGRQRHRRQRQDLHRRRGGRGALRTSSRGG